MATAQELRQHDGAGRRALLPDERISFMGALFMGWHLLIEEKGPAVLFEDLYEFIPAFLALCTGCAEYWNNHEGLTFARHDQHEGMIQKSLGVFPTLSVPIHHDILIDENFMARIEMALPELAKSQSSYLTKSELAALYLPRETELLDLLTRSFAALEAGFEVMEPHKGRFKIVGRSDQSSGDKFFGGGRVHKLRWRNPLNRPKL